MREDTQTLLDTAKELRKSVLTCIYKAEEGHPGPALSIIEMMTVLFFSNMNIDATKPKDPNRDRFILSKGHACPTLYACLARHGFFDEALLPTLRSCGSELQGHPCITTPGVEMTSGSLGNGIAIGLGMALAGRMQGRDFYTYVIVGDGELNEGVCWEGIMAAKRQQAGRLIVLVDENCFQSGGKVQDISCGGHIAQKFEAFGFHVQTVDGHDISAISQAVDLAKAELTTPSVIVCKTIKGKGVSFMQNDNSWHKRVITKENYEQAMRELEG